MKFRNRLFAVIMCVVMIVTMAVSIKVMTVSATENNCRITIEYKDDGKPIKGAVFNFYRVGALNDKGNITLSGNFKDYTIYTETEDYAAIAQTLYGYALKDNVAYDYSAICNEYGTAYVKDIPEGVYLVTSEPIENNGNIYVAEPHLVFLPWWDSKTNKWYSQVISRPKHTILETDKKVSVKVLKKWEDREKDNNAPDSIEVVLLKDGRYYDKAVLTAENDWRCIWNDLPSSSVWTIVEELFDNYYVIQTQEGITRLITNYYTDPPSHNNTVPSETLTSDPTVPDETVETTSTETTDGLVPTTPTGGDDDYHDTPDYTTKLPQTGMLWWPVPLLVLVGLVLVVVGVIKRRGEDFEA